MSNGPYSHIINSQLVPVFPEDAMVPLSPGTYVPGNGAGPNTLMGMTQGNSITDGIAEVGAGSAVNDTVSTIASSAGGFVGSTPFWLLVLGAIAYLVLWKIHFHTAASAGVGD